MDNSNKPCAKKPLLGILGGIGPLSSAYLYELITSHTPAERDQDHIDIVLCSRASTPDRTAFIVGKSGEDPAEILADDARKLVAFGATYLAIACNTAHYFYDKIRSSVDVPVLNIMRETVESVFSMGIRRVGLMATEGTVKVGVYKKMCEAYGIECLSPGEKGQQKVTDIIYNSVKRGKKPEMRHFFSVADELNAMGCEKVILGCTELSLVKKEFALDEYYLDALEVLACRAIEKAGKTPVGFSF